MRRHNHKRQPRWAAQGEHLGPNPNTHKPHCTCNYTLCPHPSLELTQTNPLHKVDSEVVNFFATYEIDNEDEPPVPHVLSQDQYNVSEESAPYDTWLLLEPIGADAE